MALLAVACLAAFPAYAEGSAATPNPDRVAGVSKPPRPGPSAPDEAARARVNAAYGKLPISFEANRGQTDSRVDFLSRGSNYSLFLTSTEAVAVLRNGTSGDSSVLRMELVGGNPRPSVEGQEPRSGRSNYFIGNDPAQWHTGVPSFARVKYGDVWPGIDLVYHGSQRQLEYDFIVAPHADPEPIRLSFQGTREMRVDGNGDLVLQLSGGELRNRKPVAYQEIDGVKSIVSASYVIDSGNTVAFRLGAYDPAVALVIDPTVVYSTYLGGSGYDNAFGIAVDAAGNAYVTGFTRSTDFPTTAGAFQTTNPGVIAFVTKLNPAGSGLVYSTYLGGGTADAITVDAAGNAYVAGRTDSTDFPTTAGAFQTTNAGITAFVTKLNPAGSGLLYSTYLGGSGDDSASGIAVDAAGNAYVTGFTLSTDFPTTAGAFQTVNPGGVSGVSAFVTKLNPAGSGLLYSTYLGGSSTQSGLTQSGNGIALGAAGNAYVTGYTVSTNFPTTAGAFQTTFAGGDGYLGDAFVTKLNPAGSGLLYSTYLGGSGADSASGIAVDAAGNAYVTGTTHSTDFPITAGAFQATNHGGPRDAFVTKLNPAGSGLLYSTYLGGSRDDGARGIAVDAAGNAYVTGPTSATDFPTTAGASQTTFAGGDGYLGDAFVTKFNPAGSGLLYSTYLGGSVGEVSSGIAIDAAGNAYVTGETPSTNFPTTDGAFQTTYAGVVDVFVTKLALKQRVLCCGDFNGDNKDDILWRNSDGTLYEWWLSGTSEIGGGSPGVVGADWAVVGIGDFNGDGKADILWRHNSGEVYLWLLNGTAILSESSLGVVTNDWQVAGIGDFNGDGKSDILWHHTSGLVYEWLLNGTAILSAGSPGTATNDWQIAGIGDFNGDGRSDILWRHASGLVYEWLIDGTTISSQGSPGSAGNDWHVAGIDDFNGDGRSDILWRHTSGLVYEWLLNGTTISSEGSPGSAESDWQIAGIGDFNGDGKSDILWRHTSGLVYEWLIDGTILSSQGSPGSVGNDWQIE